MLKFNNNNKESSVLTTIRIVFVLHLRSLHKEKVNLKHLNFHLSEKVPSQKSDFWTGCTYTMISVLILLQQFRYFGLDRLPDEMPFNTTL